ncbi:hypothetical protein ACHAW6_002736 [Cyclotella cf. meneghiniana]
MLRGPIGTAPSIILSCEGVFARLCLGNDPVWGPLHPPALVCRQLCPRRSICESCSPLPTPVPTWPRCGLFLLPCQELCDLSPCIRTCSQSCLRCRRPAGSVYPRTPICQRLCLLHRQARPLTHPPCREMGPWHRKPFSSCPPLPPFCLCRPRILSLFQMAIRLSYCSGCWTPPCTDRGSPTDPLPSRQPWPI